MLPRTALSISSHVDSSSFRFPRKHTQMDRKSIFLRAKYGTSSWPSYQTEPCLCNQVLGGDSAVNGLVWVRGAKEEYDAIETLGSASWNWKSLYCYMKKVLSSGILYISRLANISTIIVRDSSASPPVACRSVRLRRQCGFARCFWPRKCLFPRVLPHVRVLLESPSEHVV